MLLADLLRRDKPLVGVRRGHVDVEDYHVRDLRLQLRHQLTDILGLEEHLESGLGQQVGQPIAK